MHAGAAWGLTKFQIAYILATAEWESRFSPIEEIGERNKPYAPYYGRGQGRATARLTGVQSMMLTLLAQETTKSTATCSIWTWSRTRG